MRRAAAASVLVLALLAAPAQASVEGALTELTGAGSCLTENPATTPDCAQLTGFPRERGQAGAVGVPAFSADGRNGYLGTQRPGRDVDEGPGTLHVLGRDAPSGRLTELTGPGSCFAEDGLAPCRRAHGLSGFPRATVTNDGRFVYAASGDAVLVFRRDAATGRLTQLAGRRGCVSRLAEPGCTRVRGMYVNSMTLTPGDRQVVVAGGPSLLVLRRNGRSGALTWPGKKTGCVSASDGSRCRRIPEIEDVPRYSRDGRSAYAASGDVDGVVVFRNEPSTGELRAVGEPVCARRRRTGRVPRRCGFGSGGSHLITLSPDERNLYMSDTVRDELVAFAIDRPREVRAIAGPFGCTRGVTGGICEDQFIGWQLELTPDGRFGYELVGGLVLAFSRDRESGALTLLPGADACLSDSGLPPCTPFRNLREPWRSRLSPDGRQLYVASSVGSSPPGNTLVVLGRG